MPITPFTDKQRALLEALLIETIPYGECPASLDLTQEDISYLLFGNGTCKARDVTINSFWSRRDDLGLVGITEVVTGRRPQTLVEILYMLEGDIVLIKYDPEVSEFYRSIHQPSKFGPQYFKEPLAVAQKT